MFDVQSAFFFVLFCTPSKQFLDRKKQQNLLFYLRSELNSIIHYCDEIDWNVRLSHRLNFDSLIYRRRLNDEIFNVSYNNFFLFCNFLIFFWQMISIDELYSNQYWHSLKIKSLVDFVFTVATLLIYTQWIIILWNHKWFDFALKRWLRSIYWKKQFYFFASSMSSSVSFPSPSLAYSKLSFRRILTSAHWLAEYCYDWPIKMLWYRFLLFISVNNISFWNFFFYGSPCETRNTRTNCIKKQTHFFSQMNATHYIFFRFIFLFRCVYFFAFICM